MSKNIKFIGNKASTVINILIHGAESSKGEWLTKDDYTKGGNFTQELKKAGLSYLACDLYGHGDWKADEVDFDVDDISDELWPKVVNESIKYIVETLLDMSKELGNIEENSNRSTYNVITYSMGSVIGLKLLKTLESVKNLNKDNIGEIIFCSLCPEKEYDDEYSLHNNLEFLKEKNITVFYGDNDEQQDPKDINWAFNLIASNSKEIVGFDSGHSLPVDWVKLALKKIVTNL